MQQIESLTGLDKMWVKARRGNGWFLTNKICSVVLAGSLAVYTASLKPDIMQYGKDNPGADNLNTYNFIYWLMFIYYSFSALDELIELYAVYFEREKGALGLLLEMNNFLGVGLIIYLTIFNYSSSSVMPAEYAHLQVWINFQVVFMYVVVGLCVLMVICMSSMQKNVAKKAGSKAAVADKAE